MTRRKPSLQFGPTTTPQGFTSHSTSSFNDLRPARIVRELIQNSLDAAVEAREPTAIVRFRVTAVRRHHVPDIDRYETAFRAAVRDQKRLNGDLSDAAQQVVDTIDHALQDLSESACWCLSVLDNGIGLDAKRMNALLGDGASLKPAEAAGSYGVGHFASIPASDLRYILYGGVVTSGRRVASGCAVLASRIRPRHSYPYAAQGYLVDGFKGGEDGTYDFIDESSIPGLVAASLEEITTQWGHGSAVVIPAFNYFGDEGERLLWDIVSKVAAYNFGAAIHHGRLVVEVDEDDGLPDRDRVGVQRLDSEALSAVLESESERDRSFRKGSFFEGLRPSGQHAHAAYRTLETGDRHRVPTCAGAVDVRLLQPAPTGNTRVDLYRNGMWITDDVFRLKRADFPNRPPFHAVLLLDASANNEFHRLVRKAEGPMHDELAFKRLARREKETLKNALRDTADWIKTEVPEVSTEDYSPDDFLAVETGGHQPGGRTKRFAMWGAPVVVQRPGSGRTPIDLPGSPDAPEPLPPPRPPSPRPPRPGPLPSRTATRSLPFRSTVVPDGDSRHLIALECTEAAAEVLLSLRVDENADATCDRIWPDEDVPLKSFRIDNGAAVARLTDDGKSIRLSGLSAGSVHQLAIEHTPPEGLARAVRVPVFRVVLHRPLPPETTNVDEG